MAIDLLVTYRDATRKNGYIPFSFQQYARDYWWPIAERLQLERLQQMETLVIRDRVEAEGLVSEIEAARQYIEQASPDEIPLDHRTYLLERIGQVVPFLRQVIEEWDRVAELYM
jgi:hypothetical protein